MAQNLTQKIISAHLVDGTAEPGSEVGLRIDQTLTQDATGTLVMLELDAMGLNRVKTEISAQYVDHNLLQTDFRNPDDHLFLRSACRRFGVHFSRAGNGVSHPVHMERFGVPGKTMIGSDSHTPAAGALGMLAIGAGGLEVALAMAGQPFYMKMPEVWGVRLTGDLPDFVSAKDVILEMLRRHDVKGGVGRVIEYYGPGLEALSAMDRHVIANMGTELGATSTVFPSDKAVRRFLRSQERAGDFVDLAADDGAAYDVDEQIDLADLEPLVAKPSSPGNVVPVADVAGTEIYQSYVGSSANPGWRDFATVAEIVDGRQSHHDVSFDVNPTSRQILENLIKTGHLAKLVRAGARLHQAGCNGCIGMGQAPATGRASVRTVPRNFPGRSGTKDDAVYLVSPETAAASALMGTITDPRTLPKRFGIKPPRPREPSQYVLNTQMLEAPPADGSDVRLVMGPNVKPLPAFEPIPATIDAPVLLKVGDNVSTDEILPGGQSVLPYRSNIPEISRFTFWRVDETFYDRAQTARDEGGFVVVAGENYGQGSSREHAAIAPRYLGMKAVLAKSYARIHWQNLANFGMLPLTFDDPDDHDRIEAGDRIVLANVRDAIQAGHVVAVENRTKGQTYVARHDLSARQVRMVLEGSLLTMFRGPSEEATA
jgi:aconitate hydratase